LTDPGAANNAEVLLTMRERAFWLFATAHRLGDLRRLVRDYGLPANSVYPTGTYIFASAPQGTYGPDLVFPVPLEEGNNPNFNASACDVTVP